MASVKKSNAKRIWICIVAAVLLFCVVSMLATKLVYDRVFDRFDCGIHTPPTALIDMVEAREEKEYLSGDNRLRGYLYRSESEGCAGLVVLAPGFRACADEYLWQIRSLLDYGWAVFAFDPTGSGASEGKSAVGFPQEVCDLRATLNYVEKCGKFGYNELVLFGHSRGGYAACCALADGYDIGAVVSIGGVNSAMEGVIGAAAEHVGPLAYGNYGFLWLYQTMLFGADTVGLRADEVISQSEVPVLLVHGEDDESVPTDRYSIVSHREDITSQRVEFLIRSTPEHDGHTDLLFDADGTANDGLMREIHTFLVKSLE